MGWLYKQLRNLLGTETRAHVLKKTKHENEQMEEKGCPTSMWTAGKEWKAPTQKAQAHHAMLNRKSYLIKQVSCLTNFILTLTTLMYMICLYFINVKTVHVKISNSFASQDFKSLLTEKTKTSLLLNTVSILNRYSKTCSSFCSFWYCNDQHSYVNARHFFNTYWLSVLNSLFPPYLAFPIDVVSSTTKHRLSASMADNPEVLTPLLTTERTVDLHSAFTSILSFTLSLRLFKPSKSS